MSSDATESRSAGPSLRVARRIACWLAGATTLLLLFFGSLGVARSEPIYGDLTRLRPVAGQWADGRLARSIVQLRSTKCGSPGYGSGFIVAVTPRAAYLVTANHVIDRAVSPRVAGHFSPARVLSTYPLSDLALLEVEGLEGDPLTVVPMHAAELPLRGVGYGGEEVLRSFVGPMAVEDDIIRPYVTGRVGVQVARPGDSGGPVIDRKGRVVAVIVAVRYSLGELATTGRETVMSDHKSLATLMTDLRSHLAKETSEP